MHPNLFSNIFQRLYGVRAYAYLMLITCALSCVSGVSVCVSCFTLVAISLERYFAICRPLHSRSWQTLKHSYKTIIVCWLLAFIVTIPIAVFTKYTEYPAGRSFCREKWPSEGWMKAYTIFLDFILFLVPIVIMLISYSFIAYTLWSGLKMDKREMGM